MKGERGAAGLALLVIVVIIGVAVALVLIMGPRQDLDISEAGRKAVQEDIRRQVSFGVQVQMIRCRLSAEREALAASSVKVEKGRLAADRTAGKIAEQERAQDALKAKMKALRAHYEKAVAAGSETANIGGRAFATADLLAEMARSLAEYEQGLEEIEIGTRQREGVIEAAVAVASTVDRRKQDLSAAESSLAALVARQASVRAAGEADALVRDLARIGAGTETETGLGLIAKLNADLDGKLTAMGAHRERRGMTDMDAALRIESAGGELMSRIDRVLGEE